MVLPLYIFSRYCFSFTCITGFSYSLHTQRFCVCILWHAYIPCLDTFTALFCLNHFGQCRHSPEPMLLTLTWRQCNAYNIKIREKKEPKRGSKSTRISENLGARTSVLQFLLQVNIDFTFFPSARPPNELVYDTHGTIYNFFMSKIWKQQIKSIGIIQIIRTSHGNIAENKTTATKIHWKNTFTHSPFLPLSSCLTLFSFGLVWICVSMCAQDSIQYDLLSQPKTTHALCSQQEKKTSKRYMQRCHYKWNP